MGDVSDKIEQVELYINECKGVLNKLEQYKVDIDNYIVIISRLRDHHINDLEILNKAKTIIELDKRKKYWRDEVILRDHHTCQRCKSHDYLTVHHVIPKSICPDHMRWSNSNGITLCVACHKLWHDTYGVNTSIYVFLKWLNNYI